ncbi:hypothetical protein CAPTEDRAFT_222251 [Capitella teleta]|uniref:Minor histocompatibility antigen H13 n=2 Tax=Capitella teleta TaxID=283909 RepID=R7UMH7_CAPTE|nr:hypothetical protein CAPTEDRAFT_222251 [Capitella teleta]|eukprot:ELU07308.1 hypothetical protein CAPTEDRAFT_222251 [Capitella teleta]
MSATEINETLAENLTGDAVNGTKTAATPEGMAVAYGSLVIMALLPIFFGAFRSVRFHREQKESGETPETMSTKDAAMFPVIASCTLFGLYVFFQLFSKEYINLLLMGYFFFLGVLALAHLSSPVVYKLLPAGFPNEQYHLLFTQGVGKKKEDIMNYEFDRRDLVTMALCGGVGVWYLWEKHWIANNLFGLAFAINGIEFLQLNRVSTGCILLGGLFIYDIFWVFGTDVMVTVAKSFEAPIKLVFPQDLLENGLAAKNFAMLGLGDIVIPGIFIALLLRFDMSLNKKRVYFYSSFVAYLLGLLATIVVMHTFKHAQPALLYLVPACITVPLGIALIRGELSAMFKYADNPDTENQESKEDKESGQGPTYTKKGKSPDKPCGVKRKSMLAQVSLKPPLVTGLLMN